MTKLMVHKDCFFTRISDFFGLLHTLLERISSYISFCPGWYFNPFILINASQFTCHPSLVFSCHILITIKTEAYMDWPGRSILAWYVTNVSVEIFFCSKNQTLIFCWKTCSMKHSSLDGQCLNIEKKQIWSRSNQLVFFCDEFVTIWVVHGTFFICVTQLL